MNAKRILSAALLALSLAVPAAAAQSLFAGNGAQVYFENDMNDGGTVSVSVDGQLALGGVFSESTTEFPLSLAPGQHTVVVTRNAGTPQAQEVGRSTITVPGAGTYTLSLASSTDDLGFDNGYALSLAGGGPIIGD